MLKFKKIFATVLCVAMLVSGIGVNAAGGQILNGIDTTNGEVVSEFYSNLLDYIVKNYTPNVFHGSRDTKFALATLGNDAGIYGAAKLVLE